MNGQTSVYRFARWARALLWLSVVGSGLLVAASDAQAQGRGGRQGGAGAGAADPSQAQPPAPPPEPVWSWDPSDPRLGLAPGGADAGQAARGMELIANRPRPEGFATNSDLAFSGNLVFVGNYRGINIYDITNPANPTLRLSLLCPGSQGDVSIYKHLLFKSDQANSARLDCGTDALEAGPNPQRFMGVRIFDITDLDNPRQVAAVQACRGSHTHSVVTDPDDPDHVYIYIQGTSGVRSGDELAGCSNAAPEEDPNTSRFQIEVIRVPLARPQEARIVSNPRVFADRQTGAIAGLRGLNREGSPTGAIAACHDITSYPAIGLAGGACSGNGLLLDISDPVNPLRLDEVADKNFSYWHSATFSNDGTKVIFTDEWGGGSSPRCRDIDPPIWGGNAIFEIIDGRLVHRSYYKLPVPIVPTCVAHNGSLIPVPGRDIKVQAWYQGGISVFDFTDADHPVEIAFFNRGPATGGGGGFWSAYWYNGYVYGSEMGRGLDVFKLVPSDYLTANEIEAAMSVKLDEFNPQHQPRITWPVSFAVTRSYLDQLVRARAIDPDAAARLSGELALAERLPSGGDRRAAADRLVATAAQLEGETLAALTAGQTRNATRVRALLAASLRDLAGTLR
jgi:hypothetical protein